MAKMDERELVNLIDAEITSAMHGGDLSQERAKAMDYYLGAKFGDEQIGRSQVVIQDVAEVVDNLMPSMLRIFTVPDNTIVFEPVGEEDEDAARQESDVVNNIFWKQNDGFMILYSWIKDGLLQKNGFIEANWVETEAVERETYEGLSELELAELLDEDGVEPIEQEERPGIVVNDVQTQAGTGQVVSTGTVFDVVIERKSKNGKIVIDPIPPEEFKVSSDCTSPTGLKDCRFVGRETVKTRSELMEMFPEQKSTILDLPTTDAGSQTTEEEHSRDHLSEESNVSDAKSELLEEVDVQIGFPRVDFDADGNAELRQVIVAGKRLLFNEPVDRRPYHVWTPIPLPHKFFGLCPADQATTFQRVKSVLVRQMLDSLYLANNPQKAVWTRAIGESTMDDLLTSRVGGLLRFTQPVDQAFREVNTQFVGAQSFPMLDWLDNAKRKRTGVGEDTKGLDVEALKNIQTSVAAQMMDLSRLQIEAVARVFAETGLKSLFLHIHEMLAKHNTKELTLRLRNKWVRVDPTQWRKREDMTVLVGLGAGTREQKLLHLQSIAGIQEKLLQAGGAGVLVSAQNLFNTAEEFVKNALFPSAERFFTDPSSAQARAAMAQRQQDPNQALQAQVALGQISNDAEENRIEREKMVLEHQRKLRELDLQAQDTLTRMEKVANDFTAKLTELEAKFNQDVPGSRI